VGVRRPEALEDSYHSWFFELEDTRDRLELTGDSRAWRVAITAAPGSTTTMCCLQLTYPPNYLDLLPALEFKIRAP
jgi:hypothetical protein